MRTLLATALLVVLTACGSSSEPAATPALSASDAQARTCAEVRSGIASFNDHDFAATVAHFEKAEVPAKVYASSSEEPQADALLDAVEYYANLDPEDYPEAARSSDSFARNKQITLSQCAADDPADDAPTQTT